MAGGRGVGAGRGRAGGGGGGHEAQEDGRRDRLRHRRPEQDVHVSRVTGGCVNRALDYLKVSFIHSNVASDLIKKFVISSSILDFEMFFSLSLCCTLFLRLAMFS